MVFMSVATTSEGRGRHASLEGLMLEGSGHILVFTLTVRVVYISIFQGTKGAHDDWGAPLPSVPQHAANWDGPRIFRGILFVYPWRCYLDKVLVYTVTQKTVPMFATFDFLPLYLHN